MGGRSNVMYWLRNRGIEPEEGLVAAIFEFAKQSNRVLEDAEIRTVIAAYQDGQSAESASSLA